MVAAVISIITKVKKSKVLNTVNYNTIAIWYAGGCDDGDGDRGFGEVE